MNAYYIEMINDCIAYLIEADWQKSEITAELIQNQIEQLHGERIEIALIEAELAK